MKRGGARIVVEEAWERREAEVEGTVEIVEAVSKGLDCEYVDVVREERRRRGKEDRDEDEGLMSVPVDADAEVLETDWWKRR